MYLTGIGADTLVATGWAEVDPIRQHSASKDEAALDIDLATLNSPFCNPVKLHKKEPQGVGLYSRGASVVEGISALLPSILPHSSSLSLLCPLLHSPLANLFIFFVFLLFFYTPVRLRMLKISIDFVNPIHTISNNPLLSPKIPK